MNILSILSGVPFFLIAFITFIIIIQIKLRRNKSIYKESVNEFMEKEALANKTIIKELPELPYYTANKDSLPQKEYPDTPEYRRVIKKQRACIMKAKLEMLHFPEHYSNTELKLKYGKNNFDKLSCLESHYDGYVRALYDWATELISLDNKKDAQLVLEEAVRMDADISGIYISLADIYAEQNNTSALSELITKLENTKLTFQNKVIEYINSKLN